MKAQVLLTEKSTKRVWDCANCVTNVTYTTNRTGTPGKLTLTIIKSGDLSFVEGDEVQFYVEEQLVFSGWVFTKSKNRWGVIEVTCYDRLRYLKASASYHFTGLQAGQIIAQIAKDFELETSIIEDTGYAIPSLYESEQTCLDIIGDALQQTLLNTGKIYVMFDDGNGVSMREAKSMKSNVVIGDLSLLTDYTYKTDIDEQTYNAVKLARPNEATGGADVYIAQDSDNIKRWGLLQLYQSVDGDMNSAQVKAQAHSTLEIYNRRMRTLSVSSLGIVGLNAGQMVFMKIKGLGDIDLDQYLLIEKATHSFENDKHTMDLELYAL